MAVAFARNFLNNPILRREGRGRWRRPLTPLILFLYATLFALAMYCMYDFYLLRMQSEFGYTAKSTGAGREMLQSLSITQLLLSCLLVTTISASSITAEKELDLWTTLRLSLLTAREVSVGKFSASIAFMLLVGCISLPICATLLLMGGISASDFIVVTLLQMTGILLCGAGATAISALCRTTGSAFGWSLLAAVPLTAAPMTGIGYLGEDSFLTFALAIIGAGLVIVSALIFWLTPAFIRSGRSETQKKTRRTKSRKAATQAVKPPSRIARSWKAFTTVLKTRLALPRTKAIDGASADGPLGERLRFANPILQRELRNLLRRWCNAPAGVLMDRAELTVAFWVPAMLVYATILYYAEDASARFMWLLPPIIWIIFGALKTSALSFMRDRNQGILKPLLMTQLTARDIIRGKLQAALVMAAIRFAYFVPLIIAIFFWAPWYTLAFCLSILTLVWLAATFGLLASWFCEGPAISLAAASALVFACASGPLQLLIQGSALRDALKLHPLWHAVEPLLTPSTPLQSLATATVLAAVSFGLGLLAVIPVEMALRPAALEKDSVSIMNKDLSKAM